jgi:hypothetical protein
MVWHRARVSKRCLHSDVLAVEVVGSRDDRARAWSARARCSQECHLRQLLRDRIGGQLAERIERRIAGAILEAFDRQRFRRRR